MYNLSYWMFVGEGGGGIWYGMVIQLGLTASLLAGREWEG
jgi:hypothetical protein